MLVLAMQFSRISVRDEHGARGCADAQRRSLKTE